jgi:hypothetical protein
MRRILAAFAAVCIVAGFTSDAHAKSRISRQVDCFNDRGYSGHCGAGFAGQWYEGWFDEGTWRGKRQRVASHHPNGGVEKGRSRISQPTTREIVKDETSILKTPFGVSLKVSTSLAGFPIELVSKISEIVMQCGSRIASAYRPGARVAGSGVISNHALKKAVDVAGNPSCIYARLKGWPGGYSTDYYTAPGGHHVHISYNRNKEWGRRFAHYHGPRKVRYARHQRRGIAQVW